MLTRLLNFVIPMIKEAAVDVQESIKAHNEFKRDRYIDLGDPVDRVEGYDIYCSDKALIISGISSSIPGAVVSGNVRDGYCVVVNSAVMKQSDAFRHAVIMHEIGHIKFHFEEPHPTINRCLKIFSDQTMELEADDYARERGADVELMLSVMEKHGYNVKKRINQLYITRV